MGSADIERMRWLHSKDVEWVSFRWLDRRYQFVFLFLVVLFPLPPFCIQLSTVHLVTTDTAE